MRFAVVIFALVCSTLPSASAAEVEETCVGSICIPVDIPTVVCHGDISLDGRCINALEETANDFRTCIDEPAPTDCIDGLLEAASMCDGPPESCVTNLREALEEDIHDAIEPTREAICGDAETADCAMDIVTAVITTICGEAPCHGPLQECLASMPCVWGNVDYFTSLVEDRAWETLQEGADKISERWPFPP